MSGTLFGNAIEFLQQIGFFDVVLPFLLVFTIFFAILEKTKIFGTEDKEGLIPKKNLNAMVAFVVAFFVITAKEIVASIQTSLPIVALVLIAVISFLMLVGTFAGSKEEFNFIKMFEGTKGVIAGIFLVVLVLIFFQSFGWLTPFWSYINGIGTQNFILGIFVLAIVGIIFYVVGPSPGKKKEE